MTGPEYTDLEKEIIKRFALQYVRTGGPTFVTEERIRKFGYRQGWDIDAILKKLVDEGVLGVMTKGKRKKYFLTVYGWKVAQDIWGPGLAKLRAVY